MVSGEEVKNGKPSPDIFIYAANQLNVLPSDSIIIEDSENGVKAGKLSNAKVVGFKNPNSGNQDLSKADIIVSNFDALSYNKLVKLTTRE